MNPIRRPAGHTGATRVAPVVSALAWLLFAVLVVVAGGRPAAADDTGPDGTDGTDGTARVLRVLHRWDALREHAYARHDAALLRSLYAAGSQAGAADVHLLREYRHRGLRRIAVRTQVLSAEVLPARGPRLRVRVLERSYGSAVGRTRCLRLPTSPPTGRQITLRRFPTGWKVAAVRP